MKQENLPAMHMIQAVFNRLIRGILLLSTILIVGIIIFSVLMRYVVMSDLYAIEEFLAIVAMWLYFISASYVSYENNHLRADIIVSYVKNKTAKRKISLITGGLAMAITFILAIWSVDFARWSIIAGGTTPGWKIPLIVSQIPLTIGFILIFLFTTYNFIKKIIRFRKGGED